VAASDHFVVIFAPYGTTRHHCKSCARSILTKDGGIYAAAAYLFLYLPLAILGLFRFNNSKIAAWRGFTLDWYRGVFHNPALFEGTINSLIKTTLDSMKGFKDAAEDAESTQFSTMFADFARERSEVATALQAEVRRLGGNPEDDSSFLAAAHRTFMDLKQAFTGKDDKAIIQEVERGEDYIKGKFEAALAETDLDPSSRAVVERAYQSVKAGHDRASALKHSLA